VQFRAANKTGSPCNVCERWNPGGTQSWRMVSDCQIVQLAVSVRSTVQDAGSIVSATCESPWLACNCCNEVLSAVQPRPNLMCRVRATFIAACLYSVCANVCWLAGSIVMADRRVHRTFGSTNVPTAQTWQQLHMSTMYLPAPLQPHEAERLLCSGAAANPRPQAQDE
jgi:hypothetical protein